MQGVKLLEFHINLGKDCFDNEQYEPAIVHFDKVISINKKIPEAYFFLAECQRQLGHLDNAKKSYKKSLRLNSKFFEAQFNLGLMLNSMNKKKEAIVAFRRSLRISPDHPRPQEQLASLLMKTGNYQEGLEKIKNASGAIVFYTGTRKDFTIETS